MSTLDIPKNYADGEILLEADLDAAFDEVETFLNTTKINDDNIQDGGISSSKLAASSVTTAKLASDAVTSTKLADNAVTTAKITNGSVTLAKMDANSVDSDQYVDGSIDREHLAVGAIARDSVTGVKTTTYTWTSSDDYIRCSTSGGGWTLTPEASPSSGRKVTVRKTTSDYNVLTISGVTTLNTEGESVVLEYDGSSWFVSSRYIPSVWTTATLTSGGSGITAINSQVTYVRREGDSMRIRSLLNINVAANTGYFVLPSSLTMDTAKYTSNRSQFGVWHANQLNNQYANRSGPVSGVTTNADRLILYDRGNGSDFVEIGAYNAMVSSGQSVAFDVLVPISGWNG